MQLTQEDYNLRVKTIDSLNSFENAVSFSLCSFNDVPLVAEAHTQNDWEGGHYVIVCDKINKLEPTKQKYGIIEHLNPAVLCFRGKQSEATWNFTDNVDERKQRWAVTAQKTKQKTADGELVNFAEQPLEIDSRAISHWTNPGEWVFVDGFGSGTSIVAALREGRSCVGTEPDPVQFEAAVNRVSAAINQALMADLAAYKQQRRQERLEQAAVNLEEQKEKLAARQKKEEERKRKKAASTVSLHLFLIVFFRRILSLGP